MSQQQVEFYGFTVLTVVSRILSFVNADILEVFRLRRVSKTFRDAVHEFSASNWRNALTKGTKISTTTTSGVAAPDVYVNRQTYMFLRRVFLPLVRNGQLWPIRALWATNISPNTIFIMNAQDSLCVSILHQLVREVNYCNCSKESLMALEYLLLLTAKRKGKNITAAPVPGCEDDESNELCDLEQCEHGSCSTTLMMACKMGGVPIIELLLRYGADPFVTVPGDVASLRRPTVLHVCARFGRDEEAECLLDFVNNDPRLLESKLNDLESSTPLTVACASGYERCVRLLLDRGADVNADTELVATKVGRDGFSVVKMDPEKAKRKSTPLMAAVRCLNIDIVKMLLATGRADVWRRPESSCWSRAHTTWSPRSAFGAAAIDDISGADDELIALMKLLAEQPGFDPHSEEITRDVAFAKALARTRWLHEQGIKLSEYATRILSFALTEEEKKKKLADAAVSSS